MRARLAFFLSASLFALGCGSSTDTTSDPPADTGKDGTSGETGGDTSTDTSGGTETGGTETGGGDSSTEDAKGVKCGDKVCASDETCCASAGGPDGGPAIGCVKGGCPDGGAPITCDGPEDCSSSAPICCAEAEIVGTAPSCSFKAGKTECKPTCDSNIPFACPAKATVRMCRKGTDCTEPSYKSCCEFTDGKNTARFCVGDSMKSFASSCEF